MDKFISVIISALPEAIGALLAVSVLTLLAILKKKSYKIRNLESLGVDNVYSDRKYYESIRPKLFSKSKNIKLHSIFASVESKDLYSLIEEALKNGKSVEILISDPSSDYVQGNDFMQLALMRSDIPKYVKKDLVSLKRIKLKMAELGWNGQLNVRLYKQQPMWSIYIFDKELFASPYLYRTAGSETPCMHAIDKNSDRTSYAQFYRHYQEIWREATIVDFSKY